MTKEKYEDSWSEYDNKNKSGKESEQLLLLEKHRQFIDEKKKELEESIRGIYYTAGLMVGTTGGISGPIIAEAIKNGDTEKYLTGVAIFGIGIAVAGLTSFWKNHKEKQLEKLKDLNQ